MSAAALEDVIPDTGEKFEIDEAVLRELPHGTTILGAVSYGTSLWSRTAKLTTHNSEADETIHYFLKCATGDNGMLMMRGEYESMSTIYSVIPTFCPKPIAWGKCKSKMATYFFICEFVEMGQSPPPAEQFCAAVANMHTNGTSPEGKFGFHTTTCNGNIPQDNSWCDSWEAFFAAGFRHMLNLYNEANGEDEQMSALSEPFFAKVIPRLLGPLEAEGRRIKPALLHGDLWHGNTALAVEAGVPMVFDACSFYGHNEYELGNWRPVRNKFNRKYIATYTNIVGRSEPVEDFDDRNVLYSIRFNLHASILFPGSTRYRNMVVQDMETLVRKFE